MADSHYEHGHMEIHQQEVTFHNIMALTKWGALWIAVGVLFFAMWLCADVGFLGSAITAAIVIVIGVTLLRERKGPGVVARREGVTGH